MTVSGIFRQCRNHVTPGSTHRRRPAMAAVSSRAWCGRTRAGSTTVARRTAGPRRQGRALHLVRAAIAYPLGSRSCCAIPSGGTSSPRRTGTGCRPCTTFFPNLCPCRSGVLGSLGGSTSGCTRLRPSCMWADRFTGGRWATQRMFDQDRSRLRPESAGTPATAVAWSSRICSRWGSGTNSRSRRTNGPIAAHVRTTLSLSVIR